MQWHERNVIANEVKQSQCPSKARLLRHFVPRNDRKVKVIAKRCLWGHPVYTIFIYEIF